LWGGLAAGPFDVGFRRVSVGGRIIDTWFPAAHSSDASPSLTFGEYLRLSDDMRGADPALASSPEALRRTIATAIAGDATGLEAGVLDDLVASPMAARQDARPAAGRYPLLLWTPRYGTTAAQSVLSEFLASHGFVVAFARPAGAAVALPFELTTPEAKRRELRSRVDDMAVALSFLETQAAIDTTRVGVIAWSYTGEIATAFQRREPRIGFVAGLSTTLVSDWVFQDAAALHALDTRALEAVYAVFTESRERALAQPVLPEGRSYVIELPGLRHGNFNALEGFVPSLLGISRVQRWSSSGPAGVTGYEAIATMLLRLARRHVSTDSARAMTPLALRTGLPQGVVVVHAERGIVARQPSASPTR
jgi:dienelactone hydrolase